MKKIVILLSIFFAQAVFANSEVNAGLAIMCYNEAAIQASLALSVGAGQATTSDVVALDARKKRLVEQNESLMAAETVCSQNTRTVDDRNNCIRENYARSASALVQEFNLQQLKTTDEACALTLP